jgi:hypothetical protein
LLRLSGLFGRRLSIIIEMNAGSLGRLDFFAIGRCWLSIDGSISIVLELANVLW